MGGFQEGERIFFLWELSEGPEIDFRDGVIFIYFSFSYWLKIGKQVGSLHFFAYLAFLLRRKLFINEFWRIFVTEFIDLS